MAYKIGGGGKGKSTEEAEKPAEEWESRADQQGQCWVRTFHEENALIIHSFLPSGLI